MIPQERGIEGLSICLYFIYRFFFNGEYWLQDLLGGRTCGSLIQRNI
jgi:hypothetical protein